MTDVYLFQTPNDGDLTIEQGEVVMTAGLETAVYLSLFGGNFRDEGKGDHATQWWGNADVNSLSERQVSRFQNFVNSAAATSANLRKAEDLATLDLAWLAEDYDMTVTAEIPATNKVKITVSVTAESFEFIEDWATQ